MIFCLFFILHCSVFIWVTFWKYTFRSSFTVLPISTIVILLWSVTPPSRVKFRDALSALNNKLYWDQVKIQLTVYIVSVIFLPCPTKIYTTLTVRIDFIRKEWIPRNYFCKRLFFIIKTFFLYLWPYEGLCFSKRKGAKEFLQA